MSFDFPKHWKVDSFESLFEIPLRNGIYKSKEFHGTGVKIINMGELFAHSRMTSSVEMKRVELNSKEIEKAGIDSGDLIFARRSLTAEGAGKCTIVLSIDEPTTFESSIIRVRLKKEIAEPEFYYYLFNSGIGKWLLGTILRQVAVSGITGSDLAKLEVPIPPIDEQEQIVFGLRDIDDKINQNKLINELLEQIAQAIFKSWFVDFEPTKAKIAAREALLAENPAATPEQIATTEQQAAIQSIAGAGDIIPTEQLQTIADLFPNQLVDSELGEIPEGWEISEIGNEVKVCGGGTPSTKNAEFWDNGNIAWTTPKDLSGNASKILIDTDRKITEQGLKKISSGLLPVDTVLLSSRAPVGYLALAKIPVAVNQGYIAMVCDKSITPEFVINWCDSVMEEIKQRASGTTFSEISKKNFRLIKVTLPPHPLCEVYSRITKPLYNLISSNETESKLLSSIRDSLLPKLLNGEIDCSALESSNE